MAGRLEIAGALPNGAAPKPAWLVVVDGAPFNPIAHLDLTFSGQSLNGNFTLLGSMSELGGADAVGKLAKDSPLERLTRVQATATHHRIQVYAGYPDDPDNVTLRELDNVFNGIIDHVELRTAEDVVELTGRDESALLAESSTYREFRNQTIASVVKQIAKQNGLKTTTSAGATTIFDSGTNAGTAFDDEFKDFQTIPVQGFNDWDLLTKFADYELVTVFVLDGTLYYASIEDITAHTKVLVMTLGENIGELVMTHNYTLASSRIGVEVASSQLKSKDNVLATAGQLRSFGASRGDTAVYRKVMPNLSQEEAGYFAESLALSLAQLEFLVSVHTTGLGEQNLLNQLRIAGTGTDFDKVLYRLIRVEWTMGVESGWQAKLLGLSLPDQPRLTIHRKRLPKVFKAR